MRLTHILVASALVAASASPALADRGGRPHGAASASASCTVSGGVVSAVGLPIQEVVNFLISDDSGTSGWVLGITDDGTWNVAVPSSSGSATYRFVSRTWGPDGSKYEVYASCSG